MANMHFGVKITNDSRKLSGGGLTYEIVACLILEAPVFYRKTQNSEKFVKVLRY